MSDRCVLVVDDEEVVRAFVERVVRQQGLEVESVASGPEALERIRRRPPDVVVTDVRMGGMDGLAMLERARPLAPDAAFIVMTGHGTLDAAVTAGRLGAVEFLHKPFGASALRGAIGRALEESSRSGELRWLNGRLSLDLEIPSDRDLTHQVFPLLEASLAEIGVSLDAEARASFRFVVQETLHNAIQHAHRHDRGRLIRFSCVASRDEIECRVEDEGPGYDPAAPHAGRGLALMRSLMHRVIVEDGGRTVVFARRRAAGERRSDA